MTHLRTVCALFVLRPSRGCSLTPMCCAGRYGRLHLWLLTDLAHADLLKHALSPASLPTATVVLVLDMARPYRVAQSLEDVRWRSCARLRLFRDDSTSSLYYACVSTSIAQWKGAVSRVLDEQLASMPPGKRHELQVTLRERIAAYKPPAKSSRGGQANANTPPRLLRVVASKPTRGDDAAGSDASVRWRGCCLAPRSWSPHPNVVGFFAAAWHAGGLAWRCA